MAFKIFCNKTGQKCNVILNINVWSCHLHQFVNVTREGGICRHFITRVDTKTRAVYIFVPDGTAVWP
jgi:hypothetical protein